MSAEQLDEMGPIDYVILEWPGKQPTGEAAPLLVELLHVEGAALSVNYGIDKLRFPAPVPVGARFRASADLAEVTEINGGVQIRVVATVEVESSPKPALVAECLFRHYA